jgi:hypothetical protein
MAVVMASPLQVNLTIPKTALILGMAFTVAVTGVPALSNSSKSGWKAIPRNDEDNTNRLRKHLPVAKENMPFNTKQLSRLLQGHPIRGDNTEKV